MKKLHFSWLLVIALVVSLAAAKPCEAHDARFGVVRVINKLDTDLTLYYRWVWRDGTVAADWQKVTILAGWTWSVVWEYGGSSAISPDFFCRFDTNRGWEEDYWEYVMSSGPSPDERDMRYGNYFDVAYVNDRREYAELHILTPGAKARLVNRSARRPDGWD